MMVMIHVLQLESWRLQATREILQGMSPHRRNGHRSIPAIGWKSPTLKTSCLFQTWLVFYFYLRITSSIPTRTFAEPPKLRKGDSQEVRDHSNWQSNFLLPFHSFTSSLLSLISHWHPNILSSAIRSLHRRSASLYLGLLTWQEDSGSELTIWRLMGNRCHQCATRVPYCCVKAEISGREIVCRWKTKSSLVQLKFCLDKLCHVDRSGWAPDWDLATERSILYVWSRDHRLGVECW